MTRKQIASALVASTFPTPELPGSGSRGRRLQPSSQPGYPAPPVPSSSTVIMVRFSFLVQRSELSVFYLLREPAYFVLIATLWTPIRGVAYRVMNGSGFVVSPARMDPEELPRSSNNTSPLSDAKSAAWILEGTILTRLSNSSISFSFLLDQTTSFESKATRLPKMYTSPLSSSVDPRLPVNALRESR